jgi:hypothetical protein
MKKFAVVLFVIRQAQPMFKPSINFAKSQLKRRHLPFVQGLSRVLARGCIFCNLV